MRTTWPRTPSFAHSRRSTAFDPQRPFGPWLKRILVNKAIDDARKNRRVRVGDEWMADLKAPVEEVTAVSGDVVDAVRGAVEVSSGRSLRRRVATLERYEKSTGRWLLVRRATLVDTSYGFMTKATFRARLRRETIIRAVVPASKAGPCHLAGFSRLMTVG